MQTQEVRVVIFNLARVLKIACLRRTPWDLYPPSSTTNASRLDAQFNVHPSDGTHINASTCLQDPRMTVYSSAEIQTQARLLGGECDVFGTK